MIEMVPLLPRLYIGSFPKSGTHLAIRITAHLAQQQKPKHWLGSFSSNSWKNEWIDFEDYIKPVIYGQPAGTWMMGHMGYKPEIHDAFNQMATSVLFVYRDLRDVAVSQTYHIENPDDQKYKHAGKAEFMALPDHQARLQAVIQGLGEWPGIFDRWPLYAPWLDCPDVLPVKFEHMVSEPRTVAQSVINYVAQRTLGESLPVVLQQNYIDAVEKAVELMVEKEGVSFRAGRIGDWEFEFADDTKALFKKCAGPWMEVLDYE